MEGRNDIMQFKAHPCATSFDDASSKSNEKSLNSPPFQAGGNRCLEDFLQGFLMLSVHCSNDSKIRYHMQAFCDSISLTHLAFAGGMTRV